MKQLTTSINDLRGLSRVFNHASFKRLANNTDQSLIIRQLKKHLSWNSMDDNRPKNLNELLNLGYETLLANYRHEYVYKSIIMNDFVLKNYSLDDTVVLNEFRIKDSIADVVIVNGTNKVFEIKTELDNLERFASQVSDYYKAFTEVYLVTHYTCLEKYVASIPKTIGIIYLNEENNLIEFRSADKNSNDLDIAVMMSTLRKAEYLKLVKRLSSIVPNVSPVNIYTECLNILLEFTPKEVHFEYHTILKERVDNTRNLFITEQDIPSYLNYSVYNQKFDKKTYIRLNYNLSKTL